MVAAVETTVGALLGAVGDPLGAFTPCAVGAEQSGCAFRALQMAFSCEAWQRYSLSQDDEAATSTPIGRRTSALVAAAGDKGISYLQVKRTICDEYGRQKFALHKREVTNILAAAAAKAEGAILPPGPGGTSGRAILADTEARIAASAGREQLTYTRIKRELVRRHGSTEFQTHRGPISAMLLQSASAVARTKETAAAAPGHGRRRLVPELVVRVEQSMMRRFEALWDAVNPVKRGATPFEYHDIVHSVKAARALAPEVAALRTFQGGAAAHGADASVLAGVVTAAGLTIDRLFTERLRAVLSTWRPPRCASSVALFKLFALYFATRQLAEALEALLTSAEPALLIVNYPAWFFPFAIELLDQGRREAELCAAMPCLSALRLTRRACAGTLIDR